MNQADFLLDFFQKLLDAYAPMLNSEVAGFTIWQYSLLAFLLCCLVRFVYPLISGGSIGGSLTRGSLSDTADSVQQPKSVSGDLQWRKYR